MSFVILRLLFDFGLVILIWLVQLIMYPGFSYYQKENLMNWHQSYTKRIAVVVMPLMVGQLVLSIIRFYEVFNVNHGIDAILVVAVWISTFLQFVPIHNRISKGEIASKLLIKLVRLNWLRTSLWTIIFLWNLYLIVI
ncbi:hypothetical protein [Aquimarina sp. SS2-1]|uniref:hypothetical protein n=1 Tax=Aquimarina besae TaxID=3342247 RepID=UPI0036712285